MTVTRSYRMRSAVSAVTRRVHTPARVLAEPPAASGLKPVYGEAGVPLVGSSMDLMVDMVGVMRRQYERYGGGSCSRRSGGRSSRATSAS